MDSFELSKFAGAVLFAGLIVFGINEVGKVVNPDPDQMAEASHDADAAPDEEPAHDTDAGDAGDAGEPSQAAAPASLGDLLAQGDAERGAKVFRKCATCHTIKEGGANRVGPNAYNTVGAPLGRTEGFRYSQALLDKGGSWGYEELDAWLENPRKYIPGNKMAYAGIPDAQDRADVILYLRENTANPPPLPAASAPEDVPATDEMPAEDDPEALVGEESPDVEAAAEEGGEDAPAPAPAEDAAEESEGEEPAAEEPAAEEPAAEEPAAEDAVEDPAAEEDASPEETEPAEEGEAG